MSPVHDRPFSTNAGLPGPSPWTTLNFLLTCALGDQVRAGEVISSALAASRLPVAPMSRADVLRFVKTHLLATLAVAVGEYSAFSLIDTFSTKLEECSEETPEPLAPSTGASTPAGSSAHSDSGPDGSSGSMAPAAPPPLQSMFRRRQPSISGEEGRPLALIALSDPLERSWLARTLVGEGLDVRSSETIHELLEILRDPAILRLGVVDIERRDLWPVLRTIIELRPSLPLIVCTTTDAADASVYVRAAGLRLLHVHEKTSPQRELLDRILRHATEPPI
jgi:hypothetical protein